MLKQFHVNMEEKMNLKLYHVQIINVKRFICLKAKVRTMPSGTCGLQGHTAKKRDLVSHVIYVGGSSLEMVYVTCSYLVGQNLVTWSKQ